MKKIFRSAIVQLMAILLLSSPLSGCQPAGTPPVSSISAVPVESPSRIPSATGSFSVPVTQVLPTPESFPTWWNNPTPGSKGPFEVTRTGNIPYTSEELMDVYSPVSSGDWPVVIVFHGGTDGKESVAALAEAIAEQGAVVFVPSRHLQGTNPVSGNPIGFEDAACSVRFARAQASQYGGSNSRLIAVGHSEGGLMGALMVLAGDEFHGDCLAQQESALVDIFLGLDGLYDPIPFLSDEMINTQPEICLRIDPFTYVGRDPKRSGIIFMLFVGTDSTSQKQAQAFRDALRAASYEVLLMQVPGVNRADMAKPQPQTVDAIITLLNP
jgi:dienelactone hydrolase